MTNPVIPAQAVEAAGIPYEATAAASQAIQDDAYELIGWEGVTRILEAAAPHIRAQAIEDAKDALNPGGSYVLQNIAKWLSERAATERTTP